ncbi:MAG TPA: hypothetical protein VMU85_07345, partial [Stellaceae bacterium]|nr:hypothetical protein [Stellaceae bacterium]
METLVLKLVATPLLIGGATLAGRRWGQQVSGWLVGLPLTSGPVAFFLALDGGPDFAAGAALGSLEGLVAEAAFALGYGWCARFAGWPQSFLAGSMVFALVGTLVHALALPPLVLLLTVLVWLAMLLRLMPRWSGTPASAVPPAWDLPARMIAATAIVLALTAAAPILGPRISGLLSTFPVFASVLTIFAHRTQDRIAAVAVLRGLLLGLFSFAAFFAALEWALPRLGTGAGFLAAIAAALAIQTATLLLLRQRSRAA